MMGSSFNGASRKGVRDSNGAFAPEEVDGKPEEEKEKGGGEVSKLRGIVEGKIDGITD